MPELKAQRANGKTLTMREQMEVHRANPFAPSCHARMDPIGFALENYDGVGKWRAEDAGAPIDATGKLPDGTRVRGPGGAEEASADQVPRRFRAHGDREAADLCAGPWRRVLRQPAVRAIAARRRATITESRR